MNTFTGNPYLNFLILLCFVVLLRIIDLLIKKGKEKGVLLKNSKAPGIFAMAIVFMACMIILLIYNKLSP